jgi:tight adherence protein C
MDNMLILAIAAFVAVASLVAVGGTLVAWPTAGARARAGSSAPPNDLTGDPSASGRPSRLLPGDEEQRRRLGDRLIQAGLYKRGSVAFYVTAKLVLALLPVLIGIVAAGAGVLTFRQAIMFGVPTGVFGTIIPSFWLDIKKRQRQAALRRALPDALDVIVICVEAGLSLPAAFVRVSQELRTAHPMLAGEMTIVQREVQMGCSTGEALRRFADRFDLEELRSLASVVLQAEKFGASVVKALRVNADWLRTKRYQRAEEKAGQAAVKLLFPTIFFIFPALYVVLLGPAFLDIVKMLAEMHLKARS